MLSANDLARRAAFSVAALAAAILGIPTQAQAWGAQGHEYVGNLGFQILNPRARTEVATLLGPNVTLGQAAVWADCVRSVDGSPTTSSFRFQVDRYTPKTCQIFDDDGPEEARITDYARRNWTNCEYAGKHLKCNLSYHFTDVNVHDRTAYQLGFFGTGEQDVVQAIKAAIAVLRCPAQQVCSVNPPFDIKDKREALFLLAHFMGDVHQPLHMGAIYLDDDAREAGDGGKSTTGGNLLLLKPGDTSANLHHEWDTIVGSLGTSPSPAAISAACQIAPLPNPAMESPEVWATQSVQAARQAYNGMSDIRDAQEQRYWDVQFDNETKYRASRKTTQASQIVTAGARLAAVLNAVWPSPVRAQACVSARTAPAHPNHLRPNRRQSRLHR
jgi:hypothetical protein